MISLLPLRSPNQLSFLCCCYIHYSVISTTSITPWLRKNIFYFLFQHHVHYVLITTENIFIFIPPIIFFLRKFSVSTRFLHVIVISTSGISVESYMLYQPSGGGGTTPDPTTFFEPLPSKSMPPHGHCPPPPLKLKAPPT